MSGFLADYEVIATFVAGVIGFGGIILTILLQHHFDLRLESKKIAEERARVLAALSVELMGLRSFCRGALEAMDGKETFLVPRRIPFFLFESLTARLDLLEPRHVQSIRHCYTWLLELPMRAEMFGGVAEKGGAYISVHAEGMDRIRNWFAMLEGYADQALKDLGSEY